MSVKTQLQDLYKSKWENLCNAIQPILDNEDLEIKPTCPLLLSLDEEEEYRNADIKLMIFGQETYNWFSVFHSDMGKVMSYYEEYFVSEDWTLDTKRIFWKGVKRFIKALQEKYPDKKIGFIWNNIIKIGKFDEKNRPPAYIYNVEKENFSVVKQELEILKPNVALFLTGPDYDDVIKDNLGEILFTSLGDLPERELAQLHIGEVPFAFRTYHPNGSLFFGQEYNAKCLNAILDKIDFEN